MSYVICNLRGENPECKYCGASKPHYDTSCEQCPFVPEAKCIPIDRVIGCKFCTEKESCKNDLYKVINCYERRRDKPISFPLLIKSPKEPPITAFEFHNLSFYGLTCFKCSYPVTFEFKNNEVLMYISDSGSAWDTYMEMNLELEDDDSIKKYQVKSAELLIYEIPENHSVVEKIKNLYNHLILIN